MSKERVDELLNIANDELKKLWVLHNTHARVKDSSVTEEFEDTEEALKKTLIEIVDIYHASMTRELFPRDGGMEIERLDCIFTTLDEMYTSYYEH